MSRAERDLARIRTLLRAKLRQRQLTERQVEAQLGWETGHVGELVAGTAPLYVAELHQILGAVGVTPKEFWREIYPPLADAEQASGNGRP